jgi:hypothetical protein
MISFLVKKRMIKQFLRIITIIVMLNILILTGFIIYSYYNQNDRIDKWQICIENIYKD